MTVRTTRLRVAANGAVSLAETLPEGDYMATITSAEFTRARRSVRDMPLDHRPWDASLPLRRADMYGDDER